MKTKTIHQTVTFHASPRRVYDLIMDSRQHAALSGEPATISRSVGGRFSAWGPHISGINLVLRPGKKIVQAWRAKDWWPDHYSVVSFDIERVKGGSKLTFTQTGVPSHRYRGHYRGWITTYWTPMKEILSQGTRSMQTRQIVKEAKKRIRSGRL